MDINLKYDGLINISIGKNRKDTNWKNKKEVYSKFLNFLSNSKITKETISDYEKLSKDAQDNIKDVGGFVGGYLDSGKRRKNSVINRQVVTLDADFPCEKFVEIVDKKLDVAYCIYSTHKHREKSPRFRLIIPLSRAVSAEEYEAIGRKIAHIINIDYFDDTTYEPSRLMYFPSTSTDGEYVFKYKDKAWINPDDILNTYSDWRDINTWPRSSKSQAIRRNLAQKQENPRTKEGIIGSFCRTYDVRSAIDKFLKEVYTPCENNNRYTYKNGSSSGGLVIYEDGDFAYSNHATDLASGRLCNAFDLVRIHKFSNLDESTKDEVEVCDLPSYKKMIEFCMEDEKVRHRVGMENIKLARVDFFEGCVEDEKLEEQIKEKSARMDLLKEVEVEKKSKGENLKEESEDSWMTKLSINKYGKCMSTIDNTVLILENDTNLKDKIALNEFSNRIMVKENLPWRKIENHLEGDEWSDCDDASLRHYLENIYGISSIPKTMDSFLIVANKNQYHPIRDYIKSLTWDKNKRLENLFIDYLGARDSDYTKAVTKKSLVGAVARVFNPGVKFDYMLVLVGSQGLGKSNIINLLGKDWYSDTINTIQGKESYEQLSGVWIGEMAELSALRKSEVENIKHFISKRSDRYREAYGKRVIEHKRQCVLFGTTNNDEFLKDKTGNRRFWPVEVGIFEKKKNMWEELTKEEIDQIWAEAYEIYKNGEELFLKGEIEKEAVRVQDMHTEENSKEGLIAKYLETLLPTDWDNMDIYERRKFLHEKDLFEHRKGAVQREKVCSLEVWVELFQGDVKQMTYMNSREINDILRRLKGWKSYNASGKKLSFGPHYGRQRAFVRDN